MPENALELSDMEQIVNLLDTALNPSEQRVIPERRRLLMEGLAKLVDADVWLWSNTVSNPDIPGDLMTTCIVDGGWESTERQLNAYRLLSTPEFGGRFMRNIYKHVLEGRRATLLNHEMFPEVDYASLMEAWSPTGLEYCILSIYPLGEGRSSNSGLHRLRGKPDFTVREKAIVQTVFSYVGSLHRYGENESNHETTVSLSPRERLTLVLILAGHSHKEIADRLKISRHTVNDYVKALHRAYEVSSRAELQSKFFLGT